MRGLRNITLGLLVTASVSGATVWAQKAKPAPGSSRWTLQIVSAPNDATPPRPTIVAGTGNTDGATVTYDPAQSAEVSVEAVPSDRQNSWNSFRLSLKNAAPYAPKAIVDTPAWRWLSFRHVAFATAGGAFSTISGGYTSAADLLAPVWTDTGYDWPFQGEGVPEPYGPPTYQADFMNGLPHPQQFYEEVRLQVAFQGPSFLDMQEGDSREVEANSVIAIWSKRDCEAPQARGIGLSGTRLPNALPATIRREGNTWRITVEQAVKLIEFGYVRQVSPRTQKSSCEMYLAGGWWTTPLSYTLVFTRETQ